LKGRKKISYYCELSGLDDVCHEQHSVIRIDGRKDRVKTNRPGLIRLKSFRIDGRRTDRVTTNKADRQRQMFQNLL
jgi:hypothetical protein